MTIVKVANDLIHYEKIILHEPFSTLHALFIDFMQGDQFTDHSGCSLCFVDIKIKVVFQYRAHVLNCNLCFYVS